MLLSVGWNILLAFPLLWEQMFTCPRATFAEFLNFFRPVELSEFYYFALRRGGEIPITDLPPELEGWRRRYFFISRIGWEFEPQIMSPVRIATVWGMRGHLGEFLWLDNFFLY